MDKLDNNLFQYSEQLGIKFHDPELLLRALTHRSFVNENEEINRDNERLEFLGDAILGFIVAEMLYKLFPEKPEGDLTKIRSAMVRADSLAKIAQSIDLGNNLLMGKGEISSGGREKTNNLCRGFEALIGAIYLDQELSGLISFLQPYLDESLEYVLEYNLHVDARSELQELSQSKLHLTPHYHVVDITGPDHKRNFIIEVILEDRIIGKGQGRSKRVAAQSAARDALNNLNKTGW